jgi:serine/threonine protein kinase
MSAQMLTGKGYQLDECDPWAFGVVLYALLTGKLPFEADDDALIIEKIKEGGFDLIPKPDPSLNYYKTKNLLARSFAS